jgi:Cdc6-like AAA superfamily ATPase
MRVEPGLQAAVGRFIESLAPVMELIVAELSKGTPETARHDVVVEAYNLVCAFIDADGLATDGELWALIDTFAPLLDIPLLKATPADVRHAGLTAGTRAFLEAPSTMFEILAGVDARDGTVHAARYQQLAVTIGHTVASIDLHTSHTELRAIERYRAMLLQTMRTSASSRREPEEEPAAHGPDSTDGGSRPLTALLGELDGLVGLVEVKDEVKLVASLLRVQELRRSRHLAVLEQSRHLVFTGNPGTGKTTVARLLAEIYRTLGVVATGHLVETDRAGLVAGYVGQTATKVTEVFDRADEGVLLVDEAYALVRGNETDFGREAIDTIVKLVDDRRDRVVVIVAGYPDEMADFVAANPGLRSRFPRTIHFPDYTTDELVQIFESLCDKGHYAPDQAALDAVRAWLDAQPRRKGFGNGRLARNLFEAATARQATRIVDRAEVTDTDLVSLTAPDIPAIGEGPA